MIMHDWNSNKKDVILLIHPMLSSANGMKLTLPTISGMDTATSRRIFPHMVMQ